jgi:TRAP-type C4-dicarboxylate transport system permease small subunit
LADLLITESTQHHRGAALWLDRACKSLAVLAGVVLTLMAFMSLWSIGGRALVGKALVGDYELVQFMTAAAVAMSLPYANWVRAHVIVDFFTARASARSHALLDAMAQALMATFALLLAWRLTLGMLDLKRNADASMLLNIPTWWGYLPLVPSFLLLGLTALHHLHTNLRKLRA